MIGLGLALLGRRAIALVICGLLVTGALGWVASGGPQELARGVLGRFQDAEEKQTDGNRARGGGESSAGRSLPRVRERARPPLPDVSELAERRTSLLERVGSALWLVGRVAGATLLIVGLPLLAARTRARRRRTYRRFWVRPSQTEIADELRQVSMWEAWHQQQSLRWWERLVLGQPSFAVELDAVPVDGGRFDLRASLVVAAGPRVDGYLGRLRSAWQHAHLEEVEPRGPSWATRTIRLKKRYRLSPKSLLFAGAQRGAGEIHEHVVDDLRALSAELGQPFSVQLPCVPAPGFFERWARLQHRRAERVMNAQALVFSTQGPRSRMAEEELEAGARSIAWRGLFFCDLRVAAPSRRAAEQVAGAVCGGLRAENVLRPRWMVLRGALYRRRFREAVANPIPAWRRQAFSSPELAALWTLPMPFREVGEAPSEIEPRLEPSHRVRRVSRPKALLETQDGDLVGLDREAMRLGLALVGAPNMGKSAELLRWFLLSVGGENTAGVLLDPKGDIAEAALRELAPDVTVHVINFAAPEAGFSPLLADVSHSEKAEVVTAAITEASRTDRGESTVLSSSKRYIHQVTMAGDYAFHPPTFWHLWLLCSPEAEWDEKRKALARQLIKEREMAGVGLAFQQLSAQLGGARSTMVQRLDAPANKFYMLTDPAVDRILRHPHQVDIDAVIAKREVVIVNGGGRFGLELNSMLMLMLLAMVHRAILRQQSLPERERARVALGLDEAHMFFSPTLQQMLAMNRSAGLAAAMAWHFREQISDPGLRAAAFALLRNRLFFALEKDDARYLADMLQPVHVDSIHARQEVREVLRIGPEVLYGLPQYRCVVDQMIEDEEQLRRIPAWIGKTLAMGGEERRARYHLEAQRRRGGRPTTRDDMELPRGVVEHVVGGSDGRRDGSEEVMSPAAEGESAPVAPTASDRAKSADDRPAAKPAGELAPASAARSRTGPSRGGKAMPRAKPGPAASAATGEGGSKAAGSDGAEARGADRREPGRSRRERARAEAASVPPPGAPTSAPVSASYRALARYERVTGRVERAPERAPANPTPRSGRPRAGETEGERSARLKGLWVLDESGPLPDETDLEILNALWEFDFLTQSQIAAHFLGGAGGSTVRRRLSRLYEQGWVNRLTATTKGSGRDPFIYTIARGGFEIARLVMTRRGTAIDQAELWPVDEAGAGAERTSRAASKEDRPPIGEAKWRQSEKQALTQLLHDIGAAEYTLRLARDLAANCVVEWRGPKRSWLAPPSRRTRDGERRITSLDEVPKRHAGEMYAGLQERFSWLRPDASIELEVDTDAGLERFDLFIEYERQGRPNERFERKICAYDSYRTAWWRATDRYGRHHGQPAKVLFVCPDREAAERYARAADGAMNGSILVAGYDEREIDYPGREGAYFAAEVDVHQRTTRALKLHRLPPRVRELRAGNPNERTAARQAQPRLAGFIAHRYLTRPADLSPHPG